MPTTGIKSHGRTTKRPSISEALSISLGLQESKGAMAQSYGGVGYGSCYPEVAERRSSFLKAESYLGRSYVGGFLNCGSHVNAELGRDMVDSRLPQFRDQATVSSIHGGNNLHRQTAALCDDFSSYKDDGTDEEGDAFNVDSVFQNSDGGVNADFFSIIGTDCNNNINNSNNIRLNPIGIYDDHILEGEGADLEDVDADLDIGSRSMLSPVVTNESCNYGSIQPGHVDLQHNFRNQNGIFGFLSFWSLNTVSYLPAVFLGLLLNILDALSYGMIIFPITEPVFANLGAEGLSMFYVSTVISQLIYSCGFSTFGSGIGSEMIEVTPFFHTMALSILNKLSSEKGDEVISTTIVCYALSSIITGLTFLLLGKLRLGKIVGFFPRHILIGCIGGVAYFLIITGVEVTTRLPKFEYSWTFLSRLFTNYDVFFKWSIPAGLTALLILVQRSCHGSLVLPSFYVIAFLLFHFLVALIPSLSLELLRSEGWIFPVAASNGRWYDFYKLYNFKIVHWKLVLQELPTMLALTFFGILHVPINVPALAMSCEVDRLDVDRELIAHGYSNLVSGALGSIQNYLVYTNSVLFIRAGADSSYAGILLAIVTLMIMACGPVIISFIPIFIVGSLIFLLGFELLKEVLFDTWGKLSNFEYITIIIIVLTMGVFDFVLGIIVGILLACFSFLVDSTKVKTVNGEYSGKVAKSAVYRDSLQSNFLDKIGEQIYVLKLQNTLFFGTIISIEDKIEKLFQEQEVGLTKQRIKYLILDLKNVMANNIDYSAAEGFNRIKRLVETKRIRLIISSISENDRIYTAFNKVGLLKGVELFRDLNTALEWCENEFLMRYKELLSRNHRIMKRKEKSAGSKSLISQLNNTPRQSQLMIVAQNIFPGEQHLKSLASEYSSNQPVLPLLLMSLKNFRPETLENIPDKVKFWEPLCPYFKLTRLPAFSVISGNENILFIVETGILKITYALPQGTFYETVSSRTFYGNLQEGGSESSGNIIKTETECSLWIIDSNSLQNLKRENLELYSELLLVYLSVTRRRFRELLGYSLVSS